MVIGSPEWFYNKSIEEGYIQFQRDIEEKRATFIDKFSPEALEKMDGQELLKKVFGNGQTMMELLDSDYKYDVFGSTGGYKYLRVLYQVYGSKKEWFYDEKNSVKQLSYVEAVKYAERIRDDLVECVNRINSLELNSIQAYIKLYKLLSEPFFATYLWALKYYQMLFPQYFPGMYSDGTILRALDILGLPTHAKKKRIINAGELSLFIRRCDVNNIVFNKIYADQWGWEGTKKQCESAKANYTDREKIPASVNLSHYSLPHNKAIQEQENLKIVTEMDQHLDELQIDGEEKESIVKVRINQNVFRDRLLKKYGHCCLCNVSEPKLLVASHIKPWAAAEANEKLDVDNGLLLCPNHDKLFDQGWITFDDEGQIMISKELKDVDKVFMNVNSEMKIEIREGNKKYLKYHRDNRFIR